LVMHVTKSKQAKLVFTIAAWALGVLIVCVVVYTILAIIRGSLTI
jgi:hypothetical protein